MLRCPKCDFKMRVLGPLGRCSNCNTELEELKDENNKKYLAIKQPKVANWEVIYADAFIDIRVEKTELKYQVTVKNTETKGWMRCPKCHAKSFMNMLSRGAIEIKCRRCKTITTYVFK